MDPVRLRFAGVQRLIQREVLDRGVLTTLPDAPGEICGAFYVEDTPDSDCFEIHHDRESAYPGRTTENGFQLGSPAEGSYPQSCVPRKSTAGILWHTHPLGIAPYPSGSDLLVALVKDCERSKQARASQCYLEFLFTPHGYWVITRTVSPEGVVQPSIDITQSGASKKIRMRRLTNRAVDQVLTILETDHVLPLMTRHPVPNLSVADTLLAGINKDPRLSLIHGRLHLEFRPWEHTEITIPRPLFDLCRGEYGTCLRV